MFKRIGEWLNRRYHLVATEDESAYWGKWDAIEDHRQVCICPTKVELPELTCQPHMGRDDTTTCLPHLHGVVYMSVNDDGTAQTYVGERKT
jgi:hypothetical protein